jgi:hypothetical protein
MLTLNELDLYLVFLAICESLHVRVLQFLRDVLILHFQRVQIILQLLDANGQLLILLFEKVLGAELLLKTLLILMLSIQFAFELLVLGPEILGFDFLHDLRGHRSN